MKPVADIIKNKNGRIIGVRPFDKYNPTNTFTVWLTDKEKYEEYKEKYRSELYDTIDDRVTYMTEKDNLKSIFSTQLKKVFDHIYPKWNPYWISLQSKTQRSSIQRIVNGEILPNLTTFIRLVVYISNMIDNFNFMYLFSRYAELTKSDNYKQYEMQDIYIEHGMFEPNPNEILTEDFSQFF